MILFAIENDGIVCAYNENREKVLSEKGNLYNYTENTVTIKRENKFYIYDEKQSLIAVYPKDFIDISNIVGVFV